VKSDNNIGGVAERLATMRDNRDFSSYLKITLKNMGVKPSALARQVGVTPSAVTNWTKGKQSPDWPQLRKLVDILGIPPEDQRSFYVLAGRLTEEEAQTGPLPIPEMKRAAKEEYARKMIPNLDRQDLDTVIKWMDQKEGAAT
jgi:transcriptional regulator with XRE-family HTH domain